MAGARGDQNNVTLDGLDVNDFATGQAFATVGDAPVDSIQEFRAETANPLAASGRGSFFYGETRSQRNFPSLFNPAGTNAFTFGTNALTFGPVLTDPFLSQQVQRRTIPIPVFRGDFTYVRGRHNIQVGDTFTDSRLCRVANNPL